MNKNFGNLNLNRIMSNFIKFNAWLENRINEMAPPQPPTGANAGVAVDPKMKADAAKKSLLATTKYNIDMSKIAKDPRALKQAQDKIIGDPQLGPDVAANLFKNIGM